MAKSHQDMPGLLIGALPGGGGEWGREGREEEGGIANDCKTAMEECLYTVLRARIIFLK